MKKTEHPTSNIQHRTSKELHTRATIGCWALDVGCWMLNTLSLTPALSRSAGEGERPLHPCSLHSSYISALTVLLLLLFSVTGQVAAAAEEPLSATGITEPVADVILSASVPGIVSQWHFKEGEFVKAGDVILELDNRIEELEVERRKAVMENRKSDLDSLQTLAVRNSISVKKEDLDKAETEYRIARTEFEMAQEQLRRRRVVTPIGGTIVEIARDVGEACQAYQPLIRVVDTRRCYFVSNVEATLSAGLTMNQPVRLEIEAASEPVTVRGSISYLAPVVDPASGLRRVKVVFENADGAIRPGVAGRMWIE